MQAQLKQQTVTVERDGIKVVMNGQMQIIELQLDNSKEAPAQAETIKNLINEAVKELQKKMAKGLDLSSLGF